MDIASIEEFLVPQNLKEAVLPSQEEYAYWCNRKNRTFYIDYEIDEDYSLLELSKVIIQMNMDEASIPKEELKPIYLFIHSYGGDLEQTFGFCDLVISSRIPIVTICFGAAMSAGLLIFLSGHKRLAFNHSQVLIHSGSAGFTGTAEQIEEAQKAYKKQIAEMKTYILERTKIDEQTFEDNKSKDWYIDGEDLIKYNIANKFIKSIDEMWK